jgi:hypothetical protein
MMSDGIISRFDTITKNESQLSGGECGEVKGEKKVHF